MMSIRLSLRGLWHRLMHCITEDIFRMNHTDPLQSLAQEGEAPTEVRSRGRWQSGWRNLMWILSAGWRLALTRTVIWERLTVEEEPMLCLDAVWTSVIRRAIIFYMKKFLRRVASFRNLFRVHSRFPCFFRRETGLSPDCRTM